MSVLEILIHAFLNLTPWALSFRRKRSQKIWNRSWVGGPTLLIGFVDTYGATTGILRTPPPTQPPSRNPDLAPSVFHIFGSLKKHVDGKRFAVDADVKQDVTS